MLNKKYYPSLGFILFFLTIISSVLFIQFIYTPFSYEKAIQYEKEGHKAFKKQAYAQAYEYFLKAASIDDTNKTRSYRYRCAGTALSEEGKFTSAILLYTEAIKYDKNNIAAKKGIQWIQNKDMKNKITYINRYADKWSKGNEGIININIVDKSRNYQLTYFTTNPKNMEYKIKIFVDATLYKEELIKKRQIKQMNIILFKGKHQIKIFISDTFNPKTLNISSDNRDLGINFVIKPKGIN